MKERTKTIFIDERKVSKKNIAKKHDIIFTRTGQVGLAFRNQFGVVHNNCFKVIPNEEKILPQFLFWFLKSKYIYKLVNVLAAGSAQPDLPHSTFFTLKLNLPPLELQRKFEKVSKSLDNQVEALQQKNNILKQERNRLLPRLLSGKLEV